MLIIYKSLKPPPQKKLIVYREEEKVIFLFINTLIFNNSNNSVEGNIIILHKSLTHRELKYTGRLSEFQMFSPS